MLGLQTLALEDALIVIGVLVAALIVVIISVYKLKKEDVFSNSNITTLRKYIIKELSRGYTESEIKRKLSDVGWDPEAISKAFKFNKR